MEISKSNVWGTQIGRKTTLRKIIVGICALCASSIPIRESLTCAGSCSPLWDSHTWRSLQTVRMQPLQLKEARVTVSGCVG